MSTAYFAIISSIILGGLLSGGFCPGGFCPGGFLSWAFDRLPSPGGSREFLVSSSESGSY